jgi:hypothetical protein
MGMNKMPFGKFRGKEIWTLPDYYIEWILDQNWLEYPLKSHLEEEWERRTDSSRGPDQHQRSLVSVFNPELAEMGGKIIDAGFRTLAKRLHPDIGGSHEQMVLAGRAKDVLLALLSGGAR